MLSRALKAKPFLSMMATRGGGGAVDPNYHPPHKEFPADSWPRHEDHDDPYYYYNKYGPFHTYTLLNTVRPGDIHNVPEEDPYRNVQQGYLFVDDTTDNRYDVVRGMSEAVIFFFVFGCTCLIVKNRYGGNEVGHKDRSVGEALVIAQDIEDLIEKVQNSKA